MRRLDAETVFTVAWSFWAFAMFVGTLYGFAWEVVLTGVLLLYLTFKVLIVGRPFQSVFETVAGLLGGIVGFPLAGLFAQTMSPSSPAVALVLVPVLSALLHFWLGRTIGRKLDRARADRRVSPE